MVQPISPYDTLNYISRLEASILRKGNEINSEDARKFHDSLITCYEKFTKDASASSYFYKHLGSAEKGCVVADFVVKKAFQLEKKLLQFFTPAYTISPIPSNFKVNDEHASTSTLPALFRKKKFYVKMIDSLKPTRDLDPEQAKVQLKHLDQFHKEFISNQSEIISLTEDASFSEQVEISQKVEQKVRKIQTKLERVISPIETVTPIPASTSLLRKQKYYIEMIDALESSDNLNQKEAEIQCKHLDKYHEKFISNQSEITASMEDASLQGQVEISLNVQQKVRKIQAKLEEIISPSKTIPQTVVPPTSSVLNDHFKQTGRSQVVVDYLDSLMKKQKSLMEQIELIESKNDLGVTEAAHVSLLHDMFVKNQSKIETYVSGPALDELVSYQSKLEQLVAESPYDFRKIQNLSHEVQSDISDYRSRLEEQREREEKREREEEQREREEEYGLKYLKYSSNSFYTRRTKW